jgi:hypothetical protein
MRCGEANLPHASRTPNESVYFTRHSFAARSGICDQTHFHLTSEQQPAVAIFAREMAIKADPITLLKAENALMLSRNRIFRSR